MSNTTGGFPCALQIAAHFCHLHVARAWTATVGGNRIGARRLAGMYINVGNINVLTHSQCRNIVSLVVITSRPAMRAEREGEIGTCTGKAAQAGEDAKMSLAGALRTTLLANYSLSPRTRLVRPRVATLIAPFPDARRTTDFLQSVSAAPPRNSVFG